MNIEYTERNVNVIKHIYDEFVKGNFSSYDRYVDPNIKAHCPSSWQDLHPCELHGQLSTKKIDEAYAKAFKRSQMVIHDTIADVDKVAVRWTCHGKFVEDFFGIRANNQEFIISGQSIYRFTSEGKIVESWQSWDMLGLLKQIGAIQITKG